MTPCPELQIEDYSFLEENFFTAANNSPSGSGNTTPTNLNSSESADSLSGLSMTPSKQNAESGLLSTPNKQHQDLLNGSCHDLMMPANQVCFGLLYWGSKSQTFLEFKW